MTRRDVYEILGLILAALAIAIPLLDKTGAVNVPLINLNSDGSGGGGGSNPPPPPLPSPPPTPETVEVPDLKGLQEEVAKDTLTNAGLSGFTFSTTPAQLCSEDSGEVESTTPPAGFKTRLGTQVALVVCE
jgi:PASTA domain